MSGNSRSTIFSDKRWFGLFLIVAVVFLSGGYILYSNFGGLATPKPEQSDLLLAQALRLQAIIHEMAQDDTYLGWPNRAEQINAWLGAARNQLKEPFHGHVLEVIDVNRYGDPPEYLPAADLHNKLGYYSDGQHYLIVGWGMGGETKVILKN